MGVYIYGIRSPKHVTKVRLNTGAIMEVAKYAYAYKPLYSFWDKEPRWQVLAKARLVRMENIWNRFINAGGKFPQGGVMVYGDGDDTITVGTQVMTWPMLRDCIPISLEDCTCNRAVFCGEVAEILN